MARKRKTPPDQPLPLPAISADRPLPVPQGYDDFLRDLKERIRTAQLKAALSVNRELIALYWHIGQSIVERQERDGWGSGVIERLARDVQAAFPGVQGFSRPNVYRMRAFYLAYASPGEVVSQAARQINPTTPPEPMASLPWFHNVLLIEKLKDPAERLW
jgi:hypothetical protein